LTDVCLGSNIEDKNIGVSMHVIAKLSINI